jgi:adenine phosphoribosyltransferase
MTSPPELDLKQFIRDVPDFPQPGVLFRDITPLLQSQEAFRSVIERLAAAISARDCQAVVGVESRGFIFGAPLAYRLNLPFVPVRKAGKLPAPVMSVEYALEYGSSQLDIAKDAFSAGERVAIVDDVLATGGTADATAQLVELAGGKVELLLFLAELTFLSGRDRLSRYPTEALLTYS